MVPADKVLFVRVSEPVTFPAVQALKIDDFYQPCLLQVLCQVFFPMCPAAARGRTEIPGALI